MKRIGTSSAVQNKFGRGKHGFANGNPATDTAPTELEAELFDHIQEEICNVIEGTGVAVNSQHYDQLKIAIAAMIENNGALKRHGDQHLSGSLSFKTINYHADQTLGNAYTESGFYRTNGRNAPNSTIALPRMEIHIAHPDANNNANARGIGFDYGKDGWGVYTTAWNNDGVYQGKKRLLLEDDIADSLDNDNAAAALSARQGSILNGKIASAVPSGTVMFFAGKAAPAGWLKANGAAVSRTAYAALFAAIGTTYGAGNGRDTFNLPDLRGEFVRGFDDGRNVDSGRVFGSAQADEFKAHTHITNINSDAPVYGSEDDGSYLATENVSRADGTTRRALTSARGGSETRPRNIAMLACIKI